MNSETVDLIATDPPFNTKRNRSGTAGFYVDNWKWGDTSKLPDQWAWNEVHPVWLDEIKDENRALYEVIEATEHCHGQDIAAFLCFLSVRLLEMHRILKPTGSLYLHCDHTANAYIRMAMDAIFGAKNFKNEIVWQRTTGAKLSQHEPKKWGASTDTIFYYIKNEAAKLKPFRNSHQEETREKFKLSDNQGRRYFTEELSIFRRPTHGPRPNLCYEWRGFTNPNTSGWCLSKERLEEEFQKGNIVIKENQTIERRKYLDDYPGTILNNVWSDIPNLTGKQRERTGSPDQKPLALYERIILASSNPGDLVLDPFAGLRHHHHGRPEERAPLGGNRPAPRRPLPHHLPDGGNPGKDAEYIRKLPDLTNWIDARLAQHDAQFRTEPPTRSDGSDTAALLHTTSEKSALTHRQMKDFLVKTFGLQCWGCDFQAPDERYLQLTTWTPGRTGVQTAWKTGHCYAARAT